MSQLSDTQQEEENSKDYFIYSENYRYMVGDILALGSYGQVAKCLELTTGVEVAIKFQAVENADNEFDIMVRLKDLDRETCHIVQCYECFEWENTGCLVFELLDKSLLDVIEEGHHFSLDDIRTIAHQLLIVLQTLASMSIVHSDIKLDNVMFENQEKRPLKVKIIDFGLAFPVSRVKRGRICQPETLRAPEVILGLPFTEAIDMWTLGLLMANMFLGEDLYPASYEYNLLQMIIETQGQPPAEFLNNGIHTWKFFTKDGDMWKFKTPEEYQNSGRQANVLERCLFKHLSELKQHRKVSNDLEDHVTCQFVDLVQKMLMVDPQERITPTEALQHGFFTAPDLLDASPGESCGAVGGRPSTRSVHEPGFHPRPSADNRDGATKKWLQRIQNFFSCMFSTLVKRVQNIQTVFFNMAWPKRGTNGHVPGPHGSAVLNSNRDVLSGSNPSTVSVAVTEDFLTSDAKEGADQTALKKILDVIFKVFSFLFKPLKKTNKEK